MNLRLITTFQMVQVETIMSLVMKEDKHKAMSRILILRIGHLLLGVIRNQHLCLRTTFIIIHRDHTRLTSNIYIY